MEKTTHEKTFVEKLKDIFIAFIFIINFVGIFIVITVVVAAISKNSVKSGTCCINGLVRTTSDIDCELLINNKEILQEKKYYQGVIYDNMICHNLKDSSFVDYTKTKPSKEDCEWSPVLEYLEERYNHNSIITLQKDTEKQSKQSKENCQWSPLEYLEERYNSIITPQKDTEKQSKQSKENCEWSSAFEKYLKERHNHNSIITPQKDTEKQSKPRINDLIDLQRVEKDHDSRLFHYLKSKSKRNMFIPHNEKEK